ncbi:MAG: helix-turn-helix domain-containing protein [Flavobacteriia bacterium]|nr:helix-turn-helix domain-containing protein [Flavobacteriia bacterium]OJX35330.1 MAG: hypothetical protein BGO87_12045 [Flavobacteriia bacterium 40-80]
MKALIDKPALSSPEKMDTLVEFKRTFNADFCELHIFETHQTAQNISLKFNDLTFTSMIQGKKQVKLGNSSINFTYQPGASVLVAPNEEMLIDFPEADERPSQCLALTIDSDFISSFLNRQNEERAKINDDSTWHISSDAYYISNSLGLAGTTNEILGIMLDDNPQKEQFAKKAISGLLMNIMKSQGYELLEAGKAKGRFAFVVEYINAHLHEKLSVETLAQLAYVSKSNFFKLFKQEIGLSPNDYVLQQRIKMAKRMLSECMEMNINEVAYQTGFSDANYFTKAFKKMVGLTPKAYQLKEKKFLS